VLREFLEVADNSLVAGGVILQVRQQEQLVSDTDNGGEEIGIMAVVENL